MAPDLRDAVWSVTGFGLKAVTSESDDYRIPRSMLLEIDGEAFVPLYVCPLRVSGVRGVDIEAFLEAWQMAIKAHQANLPAVDPRIMRESISGARQNAEHQKRMRQNEENDPTWAQLPLSEPSPSYPATEMKEPPRSDNDSD
jgi:hypothetical protein